MNKIINVKNLSKLFTKKNYNNNTYDLPFITRIEKFYALKDISFDVEEGEYICLFGKNGSGKSTLLKCICGIYEPSSGEIVISKKFSPIIEVSSAFHEMMTGRENTYTFGKILGFKSNYIDSKIDEIIKFSGLSNFIDVSFRFYSSGMKMRLVFSIISHLLNDILILDEVFSVGDEEFKLKSKNKMLSLIKSGRTIINVTHNLREIRDYCSKIILLEEGEMKDIIIGNNSINKFVNNH